jgi:hypothetical protein
VIRNGIWIRALDVATAGVDRHPHGLGDELRRHAVCHREADDPPGSEVQYVSQVEPAFKRRDVGDEVPLSHLTAFSVPRGGPGLRQIVLPLWLRPDLRNPGRHSVQPVLAYNQQVVGSSPSAPIRPDVFTSDVPTCSHMGARDSWIEAFPVSVGFLLRRRLEPD